MNRNRILNRIAAAGAAAAIAVSGLFPVSAETVTPSADDAATVVIDNIQTLSNGESWPTVTAYQIVKAEYNDYGITGYSVTDSNISIADLDSTDGYVYISADEATTIADYIKQNADDFTAYSLSLTTSYASGENTYENVYTGELPAGSFIVIVSNCEDYVYNPIIVSNYYTDANDASSLVAGYVDASAGFYTEANEDGTYTIYYAKYSTTTITKTISSESASLTLAADGETEVPDAEDVAIGDVVDFTITTSVPYYSDYYTNALFEVSDLMDAGLTLYDNTNKTTVTADKIADIVTVTAYIADDASGQGNEGDDETTYTSEGTVLTATTDTVTGQYTISAHTFAQGDTYTDSDGNTVTIGTEDGQNSTYLGMTKIVITFDDEWVINNDGVKIVITYSAMLNEDATLNEIANINRVSLRYTNEYVPNDDGSNNPGEDDNPNNPEQPDDKDSPVWRLYDIVFVYTFATEDELNKVYADSDTETYVSADGDDVTVTNALAGAVFTIYSEAGLTTAVQTTKTDSSGNIIFTGLDAGTYYMKETEAPSGYALNDTVYQVVISAVYNSDGTMASYSVDVSVYGSETVYENDYSYSYSETEESGVTQAVSNVSQEPVAVINTKLSTLPSTGGIGRYVLIGVSAAGLIALLYFMTRKKNAVQV